MAFCFAFVLNFSKRGEVSKSTWEKREKSLSKSFFFLSFFLCLFVSYLSKMGVGKRHPHQIRIAHIKRWVEKKHDKTSSHIFTGVQNQEEIMEIHFLFSLPVTRGEWEKKYLKLGVIRFYKTAKASPWVSSTVTEEMQVISKGDSNSSKQPF